MTTVGGYVDTEWGQVHYRRNGEAGPWIVLFHESPLSSAVFETVLPLLGQHARAIAFDTPGYGASDPPPRDGFEIPDYARVLSEAMVALGVSRPVLAGIHTGASIAIEASHALAGGARGLALSGVPLFTDDERAEYLAGWTPTIPFDDQGSQFTWAVERYRRIWPDLTPNMLHLASIEVLRAGNRYAWGYQAAFRHDPAEPLRKADAEILLLEAEFDLLADKSAVALALRPDAEITVLEGLPGQPHLRAPAAYARELLRFSTWLASTEQPASAPAVSPARAVTAELVETLVALGGYTHPLFHPSATERAAGVAAPLMGQGLLLLAGGLAEQSGALDHAIAMVGMEDVTFHSMVVPGTTIRLELDRRSCRTVSSGRCIEHYAWRLLDSADRLVLEATAVLLTHHQDQGMHSS